MAGAVVKLFRIVDGETEETPLAIASTDGQGAFRIETDEARGAELCARADAPGYCPATVKPVEAGTSIEITLYRETGGDPEYARNVVAYYLNEDGYPVMLEPNDPPSRDELEERRAAREQRRVDRAAFGGLRNGKRRRLHRVDAARVAQHCFLRCGGR